MKKKHEKVIPNIIKSTLFQKNNILPTVIHGDGSVMFWGCFAASTPERLD